MFRLSTYQPRDNMRKPEVLGSSDDFWWYKMEYWLEVG